MVSQNCDLFIKTLELPRGERCLIGGQCLALRRIRPSEDTDVLVSEQLFQHLTERFPSALQKTNNADPVLVFSDHKLEIFKDLPGFRGEES